MTTYEAGQDVTLTVEWRESPGGPLAAVTGVTITITPAAGGAAVLGPTTAGVSTPATGINACTWTPAGNLPAGTYLVLWSGVDSNGDLVSATELITVVTPTDLYTDLPTMYEALGKNGVDPDADVLIVKAIRAACRLIDRRTGRRFYADQTASARTFPVVGHMQYTGGEQVLLVDDIATADGLLVTSAGVSLTGWATGPDNALVYGRPITQLSAPGGWLPASGRITVTARWGWPAVPDEIAQAAQLLAARLYRRKDSPQGVLGNSEFGVTRVSRIDPDVEALIAPFVIPVIA